MKTIAKLGKVPTRLLARKLLRGVPKVINMANIVFKNEER
jgi:hypothetical protein